MTRPSDFTLQVSTTLCGVTVSLSVQAAAADLQNLLEARERVFSGDEVSGLARATLPALLPALHQARDEWHRSLLCAWSVHLKKLVDEKREAA